MCSSSASYTAFTMSLIALLAALVVAASCSSHSVIHVKEEHDVQHIIHQSWRDENVPVEHVPYISTWKDKHPGWIHKLWTDEENEALVSAHYPWFKDTYDALPKPIMKADACRALYMHFYGGVYADLDFESLRNLEPLLRGRQVLLAAMTAEAGFVHNIPNAWMASVRRHPFWLFVLQEITRTVGAGDFTRVDAVEHTTGPIMLGRAVEAFRRANGTGLTVLEPGVIYPVNWRVTMHLHDTPTEENAMTACDPFNSAFSNERCKALFPDAYAITYWAHTWAPPGY